jgi:hypothetical protein
MSQDSSEPAEQKLYKLIDAVKADVILLCASVARERLESQAHPSYKQAAFEIESLLLAAADRVRHGEPFAAPNKEV